MLVSERVSEQQRAILYRIWLAYAEGRADPEWGVRWRSRGKTLSDQKSISRSLRALERRGLIVRQNQREGPRRASAADPFANAVGRPLRTTHVMLTEEGMRGAWRDE